MTFQGKITSVNTFDRLPDDVTLTGHVANKPLTVKLVGEDIAELMIGSYGLNKEKVTVEIRGEE
jgi:hypothetical protein